MTQAARAEGANGGRLSGRRVIDVPCTIDLEQTPDSLHAYVELEGLTIGPGDAVLVHNAPTDVAFGERAVVRRQASVRRAGVLGRLRAHVEGYLELTELLEVSFSEGATP